MISKFNIDLYKNQSLILHLRTKKDPNWIVVVHYSLYRTCSAVMRIGKFEDPESEYPPYDFGDVEMNKASMQYDF